MSLEEKAKEIKWIFKYRHASGEFVDSDLYDTRKQAQTERDQMNSFGATCTLPIEVSKNYKPYQREQDFK